MKKINFKQLIISFSVVAILVLFSMILTKNEMSFYEELKKPVLAPNKILFPIVWTILYTILAVTLYLVIDDNRLVTAIVVNLVINVIWPVLFFRFHMLLFSSIWLLLLIVSLLYLLYLLYKRNKIYAYINIPYLFWCFFALYLNIGLYILNR